MSGQYTIDQLLNLVPERPDTVKEYVRNSHELAKQSDSHGYSLLHAASSYNHADLVRFLVQECGADINMTDEDGETPLFACETVDIARVLVEELHADTGMVNADDQTAAAKMLDEGDSPLVAAYLRTVGASAVGASTNGGQPGRNDDDDAGTATAAGPPPRLPNGLGEVRISTVNEPAEGDEAAAAPDPELRRRIEELAARQDFQGAESQRELRNLVQDAISGIHAGSQNNNHEDDDSARASIRRRID